MSISNQLVVSSTISTAIKKKNSDNKQFKNEKWKITGIFTCLCIVS